MFLRIPQVSMSDETFISFFQNISDGRTHSGNMYATRHARQLFPLILGNTRTAFASVHRPLATSKRLSKEEDAIKLKENPYYQKYADKIRKIKETNPEEYSKRLKSIMETSTGPDSVEEVKQEKVKGRKTNATRDDVKDPGSTKKRGLDTIMKVELLRDKSAGEITEIWKNYYKDRDAIFAVISASLYSELGKFTRSHPLFIYPIPRQDGYEMFLGQFSGDDCHFTSLVQYHKHGEHAPVQLVINHYTELQDSKGIVLMSGSTVDNGLSVTDAQLLSYQMQYFYSKDNYQMVIDFNNSPQTFDYNRVIECIGNSLLQKQSEIKKN